MRVFILVIIILLCQSTILFAQCQPSKEKIENWRKEYLDYFSINDTIGYKFIKADSVLLRYVYNDAENGTTMGISCSYDIATKFAESELKFASQRLAKKLNKKDAFNLRNAEKSWEAYYKSEWDFLRNAFYAYANAAKYDLGTSIMITGQAWKYQMVKDRIIQLKTYYKEVFESR